jgi:histone-lysine N-methyltransferase SETMAR
VTHSLYARAPDLSVTLSRIAVQYLTLFFHQHTEAKDVITSKRLSNFTKVVLFLHDNAPAQRALATQKKLAHLGFQCLDRPPYSPDLAPSDYHLFPGLKKN